MRSALLRCGVALLVLGAAHSGIACANALPALVPAPGRVTWHACAHGGVALDRPLRFTPSVDPGGFALVRERWSALGIAPPVRTARADVSVSRTTSTRGYTLATDARGVRIVAADGEAAFDALATLAQLPVKVGRRWRLACVSIADAPALRWRIVSDDISRGPFPTMRYFKERIRTLAAYKVNGWSPYMEAVFADPAHPYVAFPNALTPAALTELAHYAAFFHVALIPQQQTLAHMHDTLKYDTLANLAELPHGFLLSPSDPGTYAYLEPLLRAEASAAAPTPFFHLGADEPLDLGRGRTPRTAAVFAQHVARLGAVVSEFGARPMIWDDAIQQDPTILTLLPKRTIIVDFHYGAEASYAKYIATVARAGFDQMVSPGANDWNEIYADLDTAYTNEARFIADGKAAHVLGAFVTVWHDDGESLYEATWSPLIFAAASAWQTVPVDPTTWHAVFARAFFGSDNPALGQALDALAAVRTALRTQPQSDPPNYLFWSDPFDSAIGARMATVDLAGVRRRAEDVLARLAGARPPLHRNAAEVMRLAALRYDTLARRFQIGREARDYYNDARTHVAARADSLVYRGLNVAKYLCWELRDELTAILPLYSRAWNYESTPPGLARVRVRYESGAERALSVADALNTAAREDYLRAQTLPTFEDAIGRRH